MKHTLLLLIFISTPLLAQDISGEVNELQALLESQEFAASIVCKDPDPKLDAFCRQTSNKQNIGAIIVTKLKGIESTVKAMHGGIIVNTDDIRKLKRSIRSSGPTYTTPMPTTTTSSPPSYRRTPPKLNGTER